MARSAPRLGAVRADVRRAVLNASFEADRGRRPGRVQRGRATPSRARCLPRAEPRRSVLERAARGARVRASRRVREAAAIPSWWARAGCRSRSDEEIPDVLERARRRRSTTPRRPISVPRSPTSPTATSRCSDCAPTPRIARPWRTTSARADGRALPRQPEARSGSRSRARTTSSTPRTRGRRRRGSARRRSRTRSISGSTRRSWSRPDPS